MTPPDRETLKALLAKATPGEWTWDEQTRCVHADEHDGRIMFDRSIDCDEEDRADAAFIAAARNALPSLLADLDAKDAELERLTRENAALSKNHNKHCSICVDAQCWGTRTPPDAKDARIATLEQVLRAVEWSGSDDNHCPNCDGDIDMGHGATCGLAAALRGTPE